MKSKIALYLMFGFALAVLIIPIVGMAKRPVQSDNRVSVKSF